jgi:hypothetical protein
MLVGEADRHLLIGNCHTIANREGALHDGEHRIDPLLVWQWHDRHFERREIADLEHGIRTSWR